MPEIVSVLIPAYNAERWIGDTIKSVLNQTWPKKEIIIVNDGSSDNTFHIARGFESKSVKVVTQDNMGVNSARNTALKFAQGDFIQWLDADDMLAPDKISQQLRYGGDGKSTRVLLSGAWGRFFFRHQKARFIPNSLWQDLVPVEWLFRKLSENAWMTVESGLVSRKLTEMAGPLDERFSDDGEYFCRIVSVSEKIKFVPEAKSYYRMGMLGSLSSNIAASDKSAEGKFLSICAHINSLRLLEDSERTREACLKYLQRWLIYFYPEKREIVERAEQLAHALGGALSPPLLSWKYDLIRKTLGWKIAKNAQRVVPKLRILVRKNWDRLLYKLGVE
jgi:glycosyltransferase involved in cell wall biosynthesis